MRRVDADEHEAVCAERDALKAEVARLTATGNPTMFNDARYAESGPRAGCFVCAGMNGVHRSDCPARGLSYDSEPDGLEDV